MSDYIKSPVWLVGAGYMAEEYVKVLQAQNIEFVVIGRGEESAHKFTKKTGVVVKTGGLQKYLLPMEPPPQFAIVAVNFELLADATLKLLDYGVKNILVEKPAGLNQLEICSLKERAEEKCAAVYVAYNRRFYSSVERAEKIIQEDGGVTSFHFEFTEWPHIIEKLAKPDFVKQQWFLGNSTHVVDLAFYLGGIPQEISCYKEGKLSWHQAGSRFSGAGRTEGGALFSYQANWEAPGRWSVEVLTAKHRLIFRPLEKLQIQKIASIAIEEEIIDDQLDQEFKPGIYREVESFLGDEKRKLCTIAEQYASCMIYQNILKGEG